MWSPFREMERFERRLNRLMRALWESEFEPGRLLGPGAGEEALPALRGWRTPAVDIKEKENEIVVTAELPGIKKEDISIDVHENRLEIKAETKEETKEEKEGYVYRERRQGSFYRSLELPASVDAERTKARYRDGVLTLTLPKIEKVKKRKIEIE